MIYSGYLFQEICISGQLSSRTNSARLQHLSVSAILAGAGRTRTSRRLSPHPVQLVSDVLCVWFLWTSGFGSVRVRTPTCLWRHDPQQHRFGLYLWKLWLHCSGTWWFNICLTVLYLWTYLYVLLHIRCTTSTTDKLEHRSAMLKI